MTDFANPVEALADAMERISRLTAERDELRKLLHPDVVRMCGYLCKNADLHPQACCPECSAGLTERDVLRSQLDAVAGLLTGQPGADPTPQDAAWSPALESAQAVLRERDDYRLSALAEIKGHAEAVNERDEALDQAAMVAQGINHNAACPNCGGPDEEPCVRCQRDTAREHTTAERNWRREAERDLLAARRALEAIRDRTLTWEAAHAIARAALAGGKERGE